MEAVMDSLFQQMADDVEFCARADAIWPGRSRSLDMWRLLRTAFPGRFGFGFLGPQGTPPEGWTDSELVPNGFFCNWMQATRSDFKVSPAGKAAAMSKLEKLVSSSANMRGEYHVNSSGKQLSLTLPTEHQQIRPAYYGQARITRKWIAERIVDMCRIGLFSAKQARLDVGPKDEYKDLLNCRDPPAWGAHDEEEWPVGVPIPCFTVRHALPERQTYDGHSRRSGDRKDPPEYEWRHYAVMFSELRPRVPVPPST
jgi:hypothetical protein